MTFRSVHKIIILFIVYALLLTSTDWSSEPPENHKQLKNNNKIEKF